MSCSHQHGLAVAGVAVAASAAGIFWWRLRRSNRLPHELRHLTVSNYSIAVITRPRKIVLQGNSGAGKTRLSLILSQQLRIESFDLDRMFWKEGVRNTSLKELREELKRATDGWVCDGLYHAAVLEAFGRADLIVLLDPPPHVRMYRAVMRELQIWLRGEATQIGSTGFGSVLKMLWHASGLSVQRQYLMSHLRDFERRSRETYEYTLQKRANQRKNGQIPKSKPLREWIPLLILQSDEEVTQWISLLQRFANQSLNCTNEETWEFC